MARDWLCVLGILAALAGCTRKNPDYCDESTPCGAGTACTLETHACDACVEGAEGDAVCLELADGAPRCVAGGCVECTVAEDCARFGDDAPHCDLASNTCGACRRDAECASGLCDEGVGVCLTEAGLIHVAEGGDDGDPCDADAPCATIGGGLARIEAGRATVVVHEASAPYQEALVLDGAAFEVARVEIVGAPGERPSVSPPVDLDGVVVAQAGASFRLERLRLRDGNRDGVECSGAATLELVDVEVSGFERGVDASDDCRLLLAGSTIADNQAGGVSLRGGARFELVNDVIALNGFGPGSAVGGLAIEDARGTVEFCTVADNRVLEGGGAGGVECAGTQELSSNIVWNNLSSGEPSDAGGTCTHAFSLIAAMPAELDGGNNVQYEDPALTAETYRLGEGSAAIDRADPAADNEIDIDGDRRPKGERSDIGADESP
jgi:hypothetical protein